MKLSIITICYNIKDEIRRTCESIVKQTWQEFEWIVVDGGSTDGTKEILEEYKDRINIFISEKDVDNLDKILADCNEKDYLQRLPAIKDNFNRALS